MLFCKQCDKRFSASRSLIRHVREVHNKPGFSCIHCRKPFRRSYALKIHSSAGNCIPLNQNSYANHQYVLEPSNYLEADADAYSEKKQLGGGGGLHRYEQKQAADYTVDAVDNKSEAQEDDREICQDNQEMADEEDSVRHTSDTGTFDEDSNEIHKQSGRGYASGTRRPVECSDNDDTDEEGDEEGETSYQESYSSSGDGEEQSSIDSNRSDIEENDLSSTRNHNEDDDGANHEDFTDSGGSVSDEVESASSEEEEEYNSVKRFDSSGNPEYYSFQYWGKPDRRINLSWRSTEKIPLVQRHASWLSQLIGSTTKTRKKQIHRANHSQLDAFTEIAENLISGRVPLSMRRHRIFKRHRNTLRILASDSISYGSLRRELLDVRGDILLLLWNYATPSSVKTRLDIFEG